MFSPVAVIAAILLYVGALFVVALISERHAAKGTRSWSNNPVIYSLVLAVYCTTWTYYGSVGKASADGMLFLTIYLGPTLALLFGSKVMRRIVRLKNTHRLTSIADFISSRYAKSRVVAAIVTVMLIVGIVPYVALQLKAVTGTFELLTHRADSSASSAHMISPIVITLMIVFTVVFGIRRLDPTERHPGMVVSLATESLLKLVAFIAAGVFVTGLVFGGFGGFQAAIEQGLPRPLGFMGRATGPQLLTWGTYLLLAMSAFAFLPRQFHVGIVESSDDKHVKTAMWLTPLYLFAINLFVLPIAFAGMRSMPANVPADLYVLAIPLRAGARWLSLAVFLGGFSAAIGMLMVETMTMATMISNHLFLPIIESTKAFWFLRRHLLYLRWFAAAVIVITSYGFEVGVGRSTMLVSMGMLSFAAVTQFAPAILGGLFWRGANQAGAIAGLTSGFAVWFYTLLLPSLVRSGWVPASLLTHGPFGIAALRPEALFGLSGVPGLAHGTMWSLGVNILGFVAASLAFETSAEERRLTEEFVGTPLAVVDDSAGGATIEAGEKRERVEALLARYYPLNDAKTLTEKCFQSVGLAGKDHFTVVEWAELHSAVERTLAGAIGAASAHAAMREGNQLNKKESKALAAVYGKILANLNVTPSELKKRIDYYHDRESLLTQQANELEQRVAQRTEQLTLEVEERRKAERRLVEMQKEVVDTARRAGRAEIATNVLHNVGNVLNSVNVSLSLALEKVHASQVGTLPKIAEMMNKEPEALSRFLATDAKGKQLPKFVSMLADRLVQERTDVLAELESLNKNIEHIKAIVSVQQSYAGFSESAELVSISDVIADAIQVNAVALQRHRVTLVSDFETFPAAQVQKHRLMQILVNLISNAKYAVSVATTEEMKVIVRARMLDTNDRVRIDVIDYGIGISAEHLKKIFQHGFTTKKDGHGFGLHSSALAAKEMGGSLSVKSEGTGKGATFVLEIPYVVAQSGEHAKRPMPLGRTA